MSGDYDKMQSENASRITPVAKKGGKKGNKKRGGRRNSESQHSDIRLGDGCESSENEFGSISQKSGAGEEDEMLKREMEALEGFENSR